MVWQASEVQRIAGDVGEPQGATLSADSGTTAELGISAFGTNLSVNETSIAAVPGIQTITLADASLFGDSATGNSQPYPPGGQRSQSISADGQLVVFESTAEDIVPNDSNNASDIFLFNRSTGETTLVSINSTGNRSGSRASSNPAISPDGRFVAFESEADDLKPGISGHHVYLRDLEAGATSLISANIAGTGGGNSGSYGPLFSADGDHLVYMSLASNLISGITINGWGNLYVRNLPAETTQLVSIDTTGTQGGDANTAYYFGHPRGYSISADGRFVAFKSNAGNLVPNDTNGMDDIFVRDLEAGTTVLATVDSAGIHQANEHSDMTFQSISADGRFVVFDSGATNLVPQNTAKQHNAFVQDLRTGTTALVSINADGTAGSNGGNAVITPDGRFVAFLSGATNLVTGIVDKNNHLDVFVRDLQTGTTRLVSVNAGGTAAAAGDSGISETTFPRDPVITPDGRFVAFVSDAPDLVADDHNGQPDVFVRDLLTNTTRLASINLDGTDSEAGRSFAAALSADGRYVAFASTADDLAPGDHNLQQDVLVRDLVTGMTELASRRSSLFPAEVMAGGNLLDITPDGRYVAFTSSRGDLLTPEVPGVGGGSVGYLFVYDRQTEVTRLASVRPDGSAQGNFDGGSFYEASFSADGRFIAFISTLNDLDANVTGTKGGVYVRDLTTGVTTMISRNPITGAPANELHGGSVVVFSPDGRYVAFTSGANNLVNGVTIPPSQPNLYLYDRQTGTLRLVTVNGAGTASGNISTPHEEYQPVFNAGSTRLIFGSRSSDLVPGVTDSNNNADVFVYDLTGPQAFRVRLVSESTTPNVAGNNNTGGRPTRPTISADGRFVVFGSRANDLVAENSKGTRQIYIRDLNTNTTRLVSLNQAGTAGGNGDSFNAMVDGDGTKVIFQSGAQDLTGLSGKSRTQLYLRDLVANTTQMVSVNSAGTAGGNDSSGNLGLQNEVKPVLSADGRFVAFPSNATDLVDGFVDGNPVEGDLYLRDLANGITVLVTYNNAGTKSGNRGPAAGKTGRNGGVLLAANAPGILFDTFASDMVNGDFNRASDVFAYTFGGAGVIRGQLFEDANGNGARDTGESTLPYWTVFLDANGNGNSDPGEANV